MESSLGTRIAAPPLIMSPVPLAKFVPRYKLALASCVGFGKWSPRGAQAQGTGAGQRIGAAEAFPAWRGWGRMGAAARRDPPRRGAGRVRAGIRRAAAPEDGHAAARVSRFPAGDGAVALRSDGAAHHLALAAVRRRAGIRPAAVPARSADGAGAAGRGGQIQVTASSGGNRNHAGRRSGRASSSGGGASSSGGGTSSSGGGASSSGGGASSSGGGASSSGGRSPSGSLATP